MLKREEEEKQTENTCPPWELTRASGFIGRHANHEIRLCAAQNNCSSRRDNPSLGQYRICNQG